jgi:hypothetical protein
MRTTLTLDDDVAGILQKKARRQGYSFKRLVNDLLRAGLAASGEKTRPRKRIKVIAKPMGLRPGFDTNFNHLAADLEVEGFLRKQARDHARR